MSLKRQATLILLTLKSMFAGGLPLTVVLLPLNIHAVRRPQVNTKESPKSVTKLIKKSRLCSIMEPCLPFNIAKNLKDIGRRTAINVKLVKVKTKCSLLTTFATS